MNQRAKQIVSGLGDAAAKNDSFKIQNYSGLRDGHRERTDRFAPGALC